MKVCIIKGSECAAIFDDFIYDIKNWYLIPHRNTFKRTILKLCVILKDSSAVLAYYSHCCCCLQYSKADIICNKNKRAKQTKAKQRHDA